MPTPTCSRLLHPAPNSCRSAADDEAAYASVDFTGAATSHNPAYETLTRQGNSGAQSESNYESLDRGGEEGDTAVGAGPRLYDRLSRHGRQDSFHGFGGGGSNMHDGDDPANHIYDSQPPSDVNQDGMYETQPLGNMVPAAALYKLGESEGDTVNAPRPVSLDPLPLLRLLLPRFAEQRHFCCCRVRRLQRACRHCVLLAFRPLPCVDVHETDSCAAPLLCYMCAGRRQRGQRRCGRAQQRGACR